MAIAVDPLLLLERLFLHGGDPEIFRAVAAVLEEAAELLYARLEPQCGGDAGGNTSPRLPAQPGRQCVVTRGPHCSYVVCVEPRNTHGAMVTAQPVAAHPHGALASLDRIGYRVLPAPASLRSAFLIEDYIYVLSSDASREVFRLRLPPTPAGAETWDPGVIPGPRTPPAAALPLTCCCRCCCCCRLHPAPRTPRHASLTRPCHPPPIACMQTVQAIWKLNSSSMALKPCVCAAPFTRA